MDAQLQQQKVEQRISPSAHVIHQVILRQGEEELARPTAALAWSGLAAGLSMGFSLITEGLLQASLPNQPWRPLISKFGYSIGFLIVIIGRQQLFTENTLTPVIPLMQHKDAATARNMLRLWSIVLLANIAGTHLVAWVLASTPAFRPDVQTAFADLALRAMEPEWGVKVLRGVFAGWLIALLVWILGAAKSEGTAIIILLTYVIGLGDLTHVVAGSVESQYLVWKGAISWWHAIGGYTMPALIGNVLGGVSMVAAVNHAQGKVARA
jgi:formate-nitrite transporter family protein